MARTEYIARFDDYGAYVEAELIRCKDCRFCIDPDDEPVCKLRESFPVQTDADGYCWKAERKDVGA